MHWANHLKKQKKNWAVDGRDYSKIKKDPRPKPAHDFRVARFPRQYLRDEDGEWFYRDKDGPPAYPERLSCDAMLMLGYFWFLKHVKRTSRKKVISGKKFTFADLGFPPMRVFKNSPVIFAYLRTPPRVPDDFSKLNNAVRFSDVTNLMKALKSILDAGYLQRDIHMKNMVVSMLSWYNKTGCDFGELMDDLDIISTDMREVHLKQKLRDKAQFNTNQNKRVKINGQWKMI